MTIIIDFDRTLFDSHAFRRYLIFGGFIKKFLGGFKEGELSRFLFDDMDSFLSEQKDKDLILMTFGPKHFQEMKIKGSGVHKYFDQVIYTGLEMKNHAINRIKDTLKEPVVFADDNLEHLSRVESNCDGVLVVRVRRAGQPYSDLSADFKHKEVKTLAELSEYIETIK